VGGGSGRVRQSPKKKRREMPCGLLSRAPVPWRVAHLPEEHKAGNEPSSATAINGAAAEESVNLPD